MAGCVETAAAIFADTRKAASNVTKQTAAPWVYAKLMAYCDSVYMVVE
jgi:hypothetical protein